jgi:hypothetical protein
MNRCMCSRTNPSDPSQIQLDRASPCMLFCSIAVPHSLAGPTPGGFGHPRRYTACPLFPHSWVIPPFLTSVPEPERRSILQHPVCQEVNESASFLSLWPWSLLAHKCWRAGNNLPPRCTFARKLVARFLPCDASPRGVR